MCMKDTVHYCSVHNISSNDSCINRIWIFSPCSLNNGLPWMTKRKIMQLFNDDKIPAKYVYTRNCESSTNNQMFKITRLFKEKSRSLWKYSIHIILFLVIQRANLQDQKVFQLQPRLIKGRFSFICVLLTSSNICV